MKRNSYKAFILIVVLLVCFSGFMEYFYAIKWIVKLIESEFEGKVVEIDHTPRNFVFKVKSIEGDTITESSSILNDDFYSLIESGIYLIKPENENYVFLIDETNDTTKLYYVRISWNARDNFFFPKEWKSKWLESSEWDSK